MTRNEHIQATSESLAQEICKVLDGLSGDEFGRISGFKIIVAMAIGGGEVVAMSVKGGLNETVLALLDNPNFQKAAMNGRTIDVVPGHTGARQ